MRAVVVADTHLHAHSKRGLPPAVIDALDTADVVLHAGDVTDAVLLEWLTQFAPVHAVLGNNDVGLDLPETHALDLAGVRVAMIHDSGAATGRERRLHKRFPDAHVVVFGHSHIPWNAAGVDGQLLFNPGSPTQRRRQPFPTFGILECGAGGVTRHDILRADA